MKEQNEQIWYFFSYDVINQSETFQNDTDEIRRFLYCLFLDTGAKINSHVGSSFLLEYETKLEDFSYDFLFPYLRMQLELNFHYVISRIQPNKLNEKTMSAHINKKLHQSTISDLEKDDLCSSKFMIPNPTPNWNSYVQIVLKNIKKKA